MWARHGLPKPASLAGREACRRGNRRRSGNRDIWLLDVTRGVPVRFTFDQGRDAAPVWSGMDRRFWQGSRRHVQEVVSGTGPPEAIRNEPWTPDHPLPNAMDSLHTLLRRGRSGFSRSRVPSRTSSGHEGRLITTHARVSPDERVAFGNTDSGRFEIYVKNYPNPSGQWRSRPMAVFSRSGAATGRSCFIWRSMARS